MAKECAINTERLWQSLMDLAKIGATSKGGNCRLALSPEDKLGRDLVVEWMRQAGLTVCIDQIGNIFGRRSGQDNTLPAVMTGSHIDTQPTGGKFDGCFGVMAGLEVIRTLNDYGIQTKAPVELAIWTNEEGARFAPAMMGSAVYTGILSLEKALATTDAQGKTVQDELSATGYAGQDHVGTRAVQAYFEAHIEQGPILEQTNRTIGVVTGSLGMRWYDITVTGMEVHAGPTPMSMRKDALYVATHLMQQAIDIANAHAPQGRGTVGVVDVYPSSRNVVPGKVRFSVDLRHEDPVMLAKMDQQLREKCADWDRETTHKCQVEIVDIQYMPPSPFDPKLIDIVRTEAQRCGYSHQDILTGAGHDAVNLTAILPTAMIFVPCKDGISHNELEDAKPEHLAAGANVLLGAIRQTAG